MTWRQYIFQLQACGVCDIYKIVEAFDEEGRPMPELIGKPLQSESIPSDYNGYIDATIEVPCSSGIYRERVIICPAIRNCKETKVPSLW